MTTPPLAVPARVVEAITQFGAASYCYAIASSSQTNRRMRERDETKVLLLAAIADAIAEARTSCKEVQTMLDEARRP